MNYLWNITTHCCVQVCVLRNNNRYECACVVSHVWTKVVAAQVTQPIFTSLQRPQHTIQEHSVCHWHLSSPRGSTEKFILILWQTHQLLISDYILWLENISLKLVADTQNFYNNCRDLNILHKNIVYVTGTCHLLGLVA